MDTKEISFNELQHICRDLYTNMCNPEIDNIKLSDILGDRELSREIGEFLEGKIAKENEYLNNEGRPLNSLPYGKCVDWNGQFTGKAGSVMLGRFFSLFIFGKSWGGDDGMGQFNVRHKRDPHFIPNLKFHCYAFNNNSDVLFSKKTHKFSENCMKYDFEDGYHETPDTSQQHISPQPTISHSGQSKAMTPKEFIETHIKIKTKDKEKSIKLSPVQCAFLDWIEKCKKKGLKPFVLKGKL